MYMAFASLLMAQGKAALNFQTSKKDYNTIFLNSTINSAKPNKKRWLPKKKMNCWEKCGQGCGAHKQLANIF
jgi:hypothetical protein